MIKIIEYYKQEKVALTYTYKQIAKITGKKSANIRDLSYKLGIERKIVRNATRITKEGLDLILTHYEPKISKTNNRYKLRIMERYFEVGSYREVARTCGVSRVTVSKIVKGWEDTGYITVDSCINFPEKLQNKGIFYRNNNWGYSFMKCGKRYYKRGFETESEAIEEMARQKINAREQ